MKANQCNSDRGFSLVELMVGMTIGLLTVLVVLKTMEFSEGHRRASSSGSDSTVNSALALYTIERDGKNAGYGMTVTRASIGCEIKAKFGSDPIKSFNLAPVRITDGANGAPDSLQFLASSKNGITLPTRIAVDHPQTAANFFVESDVGINDMDLMVAVPRVLTGSNWCSVFQVTNDTTTGGGGGGGQGQNKVIHNSGQSNWNQPGGSNIFPPGGYLEGDYLINLGNFIDHTYSIQNNYLRLTEFFMGNNTTQVKDLYPNIVQLQAVYGKDTDGDNIVDTWNATQPTDSAGWQQIRAVRVAIVARSQDPLPGLVTLDGAQAASTCDSATPHPAAVCWFPNPTGNGVKIDVNINGANPDWQRYRYRVTETTIPFRNVIWQQ